MHYIVALVNILWVLTRNLNHDFLLTGIQGHWPLWLVQFSLVQFPFSFFFFLVLEDTVIIPTILFLYSYWTIKICKIFISKLLWWFIDLVEHTLFMCLRACCYLRAECTAPGGSLEMQNVGPDPRSAELIPAFFQDPQVNGLYINILKALF